MNRYDDPVYIDKAVKTCLDIGLLRENGTNEYGENLYKATLKAYSQTEMFATYFMIYSEEIEKLQARIDELESGVHAAIKDIDNFAYKFARDTLKEIVK